MGQLVLRCLEVDKILDMDNVRIEFHPKLTVLTGRNSAGKTLVSGASVLALLGMKGLKSTHWGAKITGDNLARRGMQGGKVKLFLEQDNAEYIFTYTDRNKAPHEVTGPEGNVSPDEALANLGIDSRAISFLTTNERRPPWEVVEDSKTGDVKTVLGSSLQISLKARADGCSRVKGVVEREAESVQGDIKDTKQNQMGEIIKRWVEKGAFTEEEGAALGEAGLNTRQTTLVQLRNLLDEIQQLTSQADALESMCAGLEEVKDLPGLIACRDIMDSLNQSLRVRIGGLHTFDTSALMTPLITLAAEISAIIPGQLTEVKDQTDDLCHCLGGLAALDAAPVSQLQLPQFMAQYQDELNKLVRTKEALAECTEPLDVVCKVYRGKTLLVQLGEVFAKEVSDEDLRNAQVVVPYSATEQETVARIVSLLGKVTTAASSLENAIHAAQASVTTLDHEIALNIAGMKVKVEGLLPALRTLDCPDSKFPEGEKGQNLREALTWVKDRVEKVREATKATVMVIDSLLEQTKLSGWTAKIRPALQPSLGLPSEAVAQSPPVIAQVRDDLQEATRSVTDNKDRFVKLARKVQESETRLAVYQKGIEVLDTYLNEVQFKEETVQQLTQTFLDFVRQGKDQFDFRFNFDLDSNGMPLLRRDDLEGAIQTGGGETQVLGVLEMLAVSEFFEFPVFIDEVGSYLHGDNLRKMLDFIASQSIQVILTTADGELPNHLSEWGIEYRGYLFTKDPSGFTQASALKREKPLGLL